MSDFSELVKDCHVEAFRVAARIVGDERAKDVTQQVYLALVQGRLKLDEARQPCAVLRAWAARIALDTLRRERNLRDRERRPAMMIDEAIRPSEKAERRELRSAMLGELAGLPERLRDAVVLRYQERMTLKQVAGALECSIPTAKERSENGLSQLQRALRRGGLVGGIAASAESLLAAGSTEFLPPPGLEAKLLGLSKSTLLGAFVASPSLMLIPIAVLGLLLGGIAMTSEPDPLPEDSMSLALGELEHDPNSGPRRAERDQEAPPTRPLPLPLPLRPNTSGASASLDGPDQPTLTPRRWLSGRLLDDKQAPIEAAKLYVVTTQRDGKFPAATVEATSGADGRFRIGLPEARGLLHWRFHAQREGFVHHRSAAIPIPIGEDVNIGDLTIFADSEERHGDFELKLDIRDPEGEGLHGAEVTLYRRLRGHDGKWKESIEAQKKTDSWGIVRLSGKVLGQKRLLVRSRFFTITRDHEETIGINQAGLTEWRVDMDRGVEIAGRIVDPAGNPVEGFVVHAYQGKWGHWTPYPKGKSDKEGRFRIQGLAPGRYHLRSRAGQWSRGYTHHKDWSPLLFRDLATGAPEVQLQLKPRDAIRSQGHHTAEAHARFLDGSSAEAFSLLHSDCRVVELPADCSDAELLADVIPNRLRPFLGQRALGRGEKHSKVHKGGLDPGCYILLLEPIYWSFPEIGPDGKAMPDQGPKRDTLGFAGPFRLRDSEIASDLRIRIWEGGSIEGRVLTPDGQPCPGAKLIVTGVGPTSDARIRNLDANVAEPGDEERRNPWTFGCDSEGRFRRASINPELSYRLVALHPDYEPVALPERRFPNGVKTGGLELRFEKRRP